MHIDSTPKKDVTPVMPEPLASVDPEIAGAIARELERQQYTLEMIASENIASPAVMVAQGSVLTNKYAEGYPARRYYGGCEFVDRAETLAIERARTLFAAEYANVQPHSGSQANMAAYFALLSPGDRIMGMDLAHGGHLTHGSPVSFSGRLFDFVHYGVDRDTGRIDYDQLDILARAQQPRMIVAGASAYPRIIDFPALARIAAAVEAVLMVDMAHIAGLVAAGVHPSPVPYADVVTSTTHKTLRGPRGGLILAREPLGAMLDRQIFPGIQGGPLMHVIAAKAVAFKEAMDEAFRQDQHRTVKNAAHLAAALMGHGVDLVSGGTDNHMVLADLRRLDISGKDAQTALEKAGITVNKNAIPFDPRGPRITSGVRIGTPALTTRGMGPAEMEAIAEMIVAVLRQPDNETRQAQIRRQVRQLCERFPVYPHLGPDRPVHDRRHERKSGVNHPPADPRPSWDDYFMDIAKLVARRSTCLRRAVGAVIVKDKRILSTGYNGAPSGIAHCAETGCLRERLKVPSGERHELCRGIHAEQNAIIQAAYHGVSIRGATLYCTNLPCSICAKMIINAGIRAIVYLSGYADRMSEEMLNQAGIKVRRLVQEDRTSADERAPR
jgi:glycine hydroxymethyltransferase